MQLPQLSLQRQSVRDVERREYLYDANTLSLPGSIMPGYGIDNNLKTHLWARPAMPFLMCDGRVTAPGGNAPTERISAICVRFLASLSFLAFQ